jgi:peptide/nickel transport system permease protein
MLGFVLQRALRALLTLWLVVTTAFIILRLAGDPVALLLSDDATQDQIEALRSELGLDAPIAVQYVKYIGEIAHGNLGDSLRQRQPALELVIGRFPATLQLATVAFVLAVSAGLGLGTLSALRRGRSSDRLAMAFVSVLQSAPAFFVGIVLILVFSVRFGWLPSSGRGSIEQMILPAITLAVFSLANLARLTRASLLDVLPIDYIRTARSKGLPERVVIRRHALRNAALPVVTVMGLEFGALLTGAVITETVFSWPGIGRLAVDAIGSRDYPVVQAAVIFTAGLFVLINFVVDCSYAVLDPTVMRG